MMFSIKYTIERPATTKTGPNDASHIVWAIGTSIFISFDTHLCFVIYMMFLMKYMMERPATTNTGPNDTRRSFGL